MSVESLQLLSLVLYILAGVCLLLSIALFFVLDIPQLYSDLTGATARKAIDAIQKQSRSDAPLSQKLEKKKSKAKAAKAAAAETTVLSDTVQETTVLSNSVQETTLLSSVEETAHLSADVQETTILPQYEVAHTDALPVMPVQDQVNTPPAPAVNFSIDVEIGFAASQELIE